MTCRSLVRHAASGRFIATLVAVVLTGCGTLAAAAAGDLDPSFDGDGRVITDFSGQNDAAQGLAIQPDGKIVVVGFTRVGTKQHMAVARYTTDGSLDPGFGTGGKLTIDPHAGDPESHNHRAQQVVIQPDGKLVIAGSASLNVAGAVLNDYAVARVNTNGTLDAGFGAGGTQTFDIGGPVDFAFAVGLQSDGKIVLAGRAGDQSTVDVGLARLLPDGQLDLAYGTTGTGTVRSDVTGSWDEGADLVVLADNSLVVAVQALVVTGFRFTLVHYAADGVGSANVVHTPIGPMNDFSVAVAVQPDGKFVVAGQVSSGTVNDFGIVRYDANLVLDPTFGTSGMLLVDFFGGGDGANDVALQPDGKLVVVGVAANGTSTGLGLLRAHP